LFIYFIHARQISILSVLPQTRSPRDYAAIFHHGGFTSRAKDWTLVYSEIFATKTEALKKEKELKGWKNRDRIKELIKKTE